MAKQLNVDLRFTADNAQAKKQIQDLQSALNSLMASTSKNSSGLGLTKDIAEATNEVAKLQAMLESSKNSSGGLDLGKFNQSLSQGKVKISDYAKTLSSLGPEGDRAFAKLAKAIINAEVPLKRTNSVLKEFKTSLANTARWQLSSSMLHGFMGAVQSAYGYAQDLNESLNEIRIVTGQNIDQMARFAQEANKAAQALSTTTTQYTDASLIYYQQGLSDAEVAERTEVTIKMANAAGQSAQLVSDQLTAVWNNFYDGSKSLEYYADVMTALGAATASSTDEIAGGLEKFAAIGETIGLSYEYAASALATITSNTRQSEEVVGTALKTIFARIQGLNLGETLDDGTSLNKYSAALEKVGISIFEQNGEIKKMDSILDEMAAKWGTLAKDQQIALAQTVAGVRQYTQLIALMDNWDAGDSDSMLANLNTAYNATGTLTEQADIYAESWEAAEKRVTAAAEEIYNQLLNDKFFIELNNGFAGFLNVVSDTIDAVGGLPGVLSVASVIMFKMFGKDMAKAIDDWGYNIKLRSQEGLAEIKKMREESISALQNMYGDNVDTGPVNSASARIFETQANLANDLLLKEEQLLAKGQALSEEKRKEAQYLIQINEELGEQALKSAQSLEAEQAKGDEIERQLLLLVRRHNLAPGDGNHQVDIANLQKMAQAAKEMQIQYGALESRIKSLSSQKDLNADTIIQELQSMSTEAQKAGIDISIFTKAITNLKGGMNINTVLDSLKTDMNDIGDKAWLAGDKIKTMLASAGIDGDKLDAVLDSLYASWEKQGIITADVAEKLKNVATQGEAASKKIGEMKAPPTTVGQAFISIAQNISNVATAFMTLKGLWETWSNDDMSFVDKMLSTLTSVGMVLPMLITSYKSLSQVKTKDAIVNALNAASERQVEKAKRKAEAATRANTKAQKDETKAQKDDIVTNIAQSASEKKGGKYAKAGGKIGGKSSGGGKYLKTSGEGAALTEGGAALAGSIIAIAAAIAIVTGTIAWAVHQSKAAERELEKAKQAALELKQNYETVKAAQEEFNNTASSYESARDALDNLTQGTEEYTQAVQAANEQAMALLAINKDLAYTIEGGQIKIDETSLENAKKAQQQQLEYAQAAQVAGQQQAKQAEENLKKRDMARQLSSGAETDNALANIGAATAAGAATGAILGSFVPVIGNAIGGVLGGLVAGVVAGVTTGVAAVVATGTADKEESAALEKLEKAYLEDDTILQKIADGSLTDAEWDAIGIEDEALRASLQENATEVSALVKEMAANTAAVSAQNDLVAANALADNEAVQNSEYQDKIIDIAGDAYGVAYDKAMKSSDWIDTWGKEDISKIDGANKAAQDVFDKYLEVAGLVGQGYTLTDTTGTDENRKFIYEDAEGNEHSVSLQAMQAARAAYEASNVLNDSATKLAATFDKLANSGSSADQALLSFVSGKNFEGATKSEFEAMQGAVGEVAYDEATGRYDTTSIQAYVEGALGETLTDKVAVRYGYETADAMLQAYAEKLANADEAWNSIKIPNNFKFADDLSLGAAKALETQISKINLGPMGEAAGKQYVEKLNEMLGELDPEDQQAALEALTKIDWSDWDAMDQAKQIMSDLGVEIDFGSEAWQQFTREMRIAGGAIPDFSGLKDDLIEISSILGNLDFGSTISEEDYQALIAYNKEWAELFILQADGSRKFIGNSQQMLQSTRDQINAEREALAERKAVQEAFNNVKWQYTDANGNPVDVDWAKAAEDGIQSGDIATARNLMNSNGATEEALKMLGYDDATLEAIIKAAEAGDENAKAQIAEMFNRMQAFKLEDLDLVDAELNEMMASTATSLTELMAMADDVSAEAFDKQLSVLAQSASSLAELESIAAFGNGEIGISAEEYSQALMKLAGNFDNCTEEMERYRQALQSGNEEQILAAESALKSSIRIGEAAEKYDLSAESLEAQTRELMIANGWGAEYAETAAMMAISNQRMNKGMEKLAKGWKDWSKTLKSTEKTSQDYADTLVELSAAVTDLVGWYDDLSLSSKFVEKNMNLIEKASTGDVNAIMQLGAAVANYEIEQAQLNETIASGLMADGSKNAFDVYRESIEGATTAADAFVQLQDDVQSGFDNIANNIAALSNGSMSLADIFGGQAGLEEWVNHLNAYAAATGMTAQQMQEMLSSVGVTANVQTDYQEQEVTVPTYREQVTNVTYRRMPYQTLGLDGQTIFTGTTTVPEYTKAQVPGPPLTTTGYVEVASISMDGVGEAPGVPAPTFTGRQAPSKSAVSGGNTGGGGGSSSSPKEPSKATKIDTTNKSEIVERYKEVNDALDDLADEYEKASRSADRLWGENRLDAIREQNKLIEEQQELLKEKQRQAEDYMNQDRVALNQAAAEAGLSFSYDDKGNITNYTDQMTNLYNQLAAAEAHYNSLATGEEQEAYEETILEPLRDKIAKVEDAIEIYEESKELFEELGLDIEDLQDQIMQNNYDIIMEGLELHISFNEEDLENIDYYLSKLEDDFYSMAEAAALMVGADGSSQLNEYLSNLDEYSKAMDDLHKAYANGEITEAAYQEGLKEVRSNIRDNLSSLLELDKAMMEYYGETLAMAQEELAKYTNRMQQQTEVLQHYGNMMEILGKQLDYESMGVILQGQVDTIENEMNVAEAAYNMYKQQAEEKRALYEEAMKNNDFVAAELYKNEWEAAQEAADEAQSEMLSKTEEWAEAMRAVVENKLAGLAKSLEEALTGGTSFDQINLQLERAVSLQEEYLTTTNQIYETNKLMRTAQQAIDKSTNSVAKQRLKDFIKETDQLQDKAKLSQYELEIQQAKYNLLLAEIALEDAQNAKSTVRLQRDSEGNFGYVYTADQTQLAQAQQELEDAQNSLYNIGLEGASNYTEKYSQTMQEMYDTLTSITEAYYNGEITSQEDYEAQMLAAQEYYYQQLENYQDLYGIALQTDTRVIQDSWTSSFRTMINNTENWKIKVNDYSAAASQSLSDWYSKVEEISQKTGLDNVANSVKKVTDESKALRDIVLGTEGEPGIINALQQELKEVSDLTKQYATFRITLQGVITEYEKLINAANRLAEANAKAGVSNSSNNSNSSSKNNTSSSQSNNNNNNNSSSSNDMNNSSSGERSGSNNNGGAQITNKYKATYNLRGRSNTISGYYSEGAARAAAESAINSAINALTGITFSEKNDIAASARRSIQIARYNTGGYTGSWGPYGKLGILDEKELILNPEDTENFLASMKILERILEIIDLQAVSSQLGGTLLTPSIGNSIRSQSLEQNVHIEASFPSVQDRNEIEEAFNTLINKASQYANRK